MNLHHFSKLTPFKTPTLQETVKRLFFLRVLASLR